MKRVVVVKPKSKGGADRSGSPRSICDEGTRTSPFGVRSQEGVWGFPPSKCGIRLVVVIVVDQSVIVIAESIQGRGIVVSPFKGEPRSLSFAEPLGRGVIRGERSEP